MAFILQFFKNFYFGRTDQGNGPVDGCHVVTVYLVGRVCFGIEKMKAELTVVIIVGDFLGAVGNTIHGTDEFISGRGCQQHRTTLIARLGGDRTGRGHTINGTENRSIISGSRFHIEVISRRLDSNTQTFPRIQVLECGTIAAIETKGFENAVVFGDKPVEVVDSSADIDR